MFVGCASRQGTVANTPSAIAPAPASSKVNGRLPPEVIQRTVRARYDVFRRCYEVALGRNAELRGRVVVRFVIGPDGNVTSVIELPETDLPDRAAVACILSEYRGLRFPSPDGGEVTVVYPIMFSPGDDGAPAAPVPRAAPDAGAPCGTSLADGEPCRL